MTHSDTGEPSYHPVTDSAVISEVKDIQGWCPNQCMARYGSIQLAAYSVQASKAMYEKQMEPQHRGPNQHMSITSETSCG